MTSPQTLATFALLARRCLDAVAEAGAVVDPVAFTTADAILRFAAGEKVTKAELKRLSKACSALTDIKDDAPLQRAFRWQVNALTWLCLMATSGADHRVEVENQLCYGLTFGAAAASIPLATFEAWLAAAGVEAASLSPEPLAKPRTSPKKAAAEALALDRMAAALGPAGPLVRAKGARFDPKAAGDPVKLAALLAKKKYPAHASVLAFDATFGGLSFPEADAPEDWFETGLATVVGAFACSKSGAHVRPRGGPAERGLVPIAYTPNDGIVFLDAAGNAWFQDTIEDTEARPSELDGAAAVARLLEQA